MTKKNIPFDMYNYHTWANQTILGRIRELPSSVLHQEVNSSYPTLAHALSHIYAVDQMWYLVLTGMEMPEAFQATLTLNERVLESVDAYESVYSELAQKFNAWFQSQPDLEQSVLLNNPFAGPRQTRFSEMILHVVNHGTYHRGNVTTMLRQLGHASTMNDYALYWYQQPAASLG
ncbi:MAG: DinB family protein [Paenibacillus sp.]|jgi:uncharacterized damage-inducible protein DinB|uniref:DinB family protein n=1 Tax=Paenibacillus sp. TaxID=58172 RepID=UPI00290FA72B|nr:DinB family protein [Paenibacillus sp.]MDU4695885.1 DinB family protein [Paenibacillus sp.]